MENKMFPTSESYDMHFPGGTSRKRKLPAMDLQGTKPEYCFPWKSNMQHVGSASGINGPLNTHEMYSNQTKFLEPATFRHQFENAQFYNWNDFPETRSTSNRNPHRTRIEKISYASLRVPPQASPCEGPRPLAKLQVGETYEMPAWPPQACNSSSQSEAHIIASFLKSCNAYKEPQFDPGLQDLESFEVKNHVITDNPATEMCSASSECARPVEILHQSSLQPNRFFDRSGKRICSQEANKSEIYCELEQSGRCLKDAGICDLSSTETVSMGALVYTEQKDSYGLLQNKEQFGSFPLGIHLSDTSECREQGRGDGEMKIEETEASDKENLTYSSTEVFSFKNEGDPANIIGHEQRNDLSHGSLKLDENNRLLSVNAASTVAEKLWDGSIQLNSSVTVSAVAFFKSGEKLLDISWSEFVEVKGKVRLEAFEKYIQDLPRSRNRGLMVISLCWKEGSSEIGLKGMKEVAKGYRKGERVGFAQISPGIDLYICPRSDTIITILAKYGFFKGMAAVEDNQDSFIGCVVWRKNRLSLNSVEKLAESKNNSSEQCLNSPSDSSTQQVAEKKLSGKQSAPEPILLASVTSSSTLVSGGANLTQSKNTESSKRELEVGNSCSGANSLLNPSVLIKSSSSSAGQQTSTDSYSPLQGSQGHLLEVKASCIHHSGAGHAKPSLELQKNVICHSSDAMKQTMHLDDDDLPEFDFRTACGISLTPASKPLDAMLEKGLPAEGIKNLNGPVPRTMPDVQAIYFSKQRPDHLSLPRIPPAANQGMSPLKHSGESEPDFLNLLEKHIVQIKDTPTPVSAAAFASSKISFDDLSNKKNLFDDDDDMPEWCPPMLHKKSLAEPIKQSASLPIGLSNSIFQPIRPVPPWPVVPLPSPAAPFPAFSTQSFLPVFHCPISTNLKAPEPISFQSGPRSRTGFSYNPALRPESSSSDDKILWRPDRRIWRP